MILFSADGTVFQGTSIGAAGRTVGEVAFTTSITGYQEITDPSYCRQIVTLTYPHIGNYGVNAEDVEASKVCRRPDHQGPAGALIRTSAAPDAAEYLGEGTVAIANIDTRRLTRVLVAYDFGVKRNILRMLASRGCRSPWCRRRPREEPRRWRSSPTASSSPTARRPGALRLRHRAARARSIDTGIPTFGICLGHQIMALASGRKTFKMKFGHHGANHPVKDLGPAASRSPARTTASRSTPRRCRPTCAPPTCQLFDGTLQGLARTDRPAFCFQGHPEASPGRTTSAYLFDRFIAR